MKKMKLKVVLLCCLTSLVACSKTSPQKEQNNNYETAPIAATVNGVVQKGPFVQGSTIQIQELNSKLEPTGKTYATQTTDDTGSFKIASEFGTRYLELTATGYYYDEVKGELSAGPLTLKALADIKKSSNVKVNILTSLAANRIKKLVLDGSAFEAAIKQAKEEVLSVFHIKNKGLADFTSMDISQTGESNATLLAVSATLQGNQSVAQLSELLSKLGQDLQQDGTLTSEQIKSTLATNAGNLNLNLIRTQLESRYANLGLSASVPDFENYVASDGTGVINGDQSTNLQIALPQAIELIESGAPSNITISLKGKKPATAVTVTLVTEAGSADLIGFTPTTLVFSPSNYMVPQTVTLQGLASTGTNRSGNIQITASASGVIAANKTITYTQVPPTELVLSQQDISLFESGASQTITVALKNRRPTSNVAVTLAADQSSSDLVSITPSLLTFTPSNYSTAQTVTLQGLASTGTNRSGNIQITASASGVISASATIKYIDVFPNTWVPSTSLPESVGRYFHTATLLPDGRVLFAGGQDYDWRYMGYGVKTLIGTISGDTITWVPSTAMPEVRRAHTATLLPDGRVLLTGGLSISTSSATLLSTTLIGTISGDTITWVPSTAMPEAREGHTATLLPDGRVLLTGGGYHGPTLASTLIGTISGDTITWVPSTAMPEARDGHTATLLPDGRVLLTGGGYNGPTLASTLIGTISGDTITWVPSTAMPKARDGHTATLLPDGRVLLTGGKEGFDSSTLIGTISGDTITWVPSTAISRERYNHTATLLPDGRILLAGSGNISNQTSWTTLIGTD